MEGGALRCPKAETGPEADAESVPDAALSKPPSQLSLAPLLPPEALPDGRHTGRIVPETAADQAVPGRLTGLRPVPPIWVDLSSVMASAG